MAEKDTKRKAFNFLRSYFDVLNELKDDSDKLDFLLSIINKQFLDEDPKDLGFVAKLCYESQRHSIESSVKGWIRVAKTDLQGNPITNPLTNPLTNPKEVEVEVEEEEEVEKILDFEKFTSWFNTRRTQYLEIPSNIKRLTYSEKTTLGLLKADYSKEDFELAMYNLCNDQWTCENKQVLCSYFLQTKIFNKFLSAEKKPMLTKKQRINRGWKS
jgi:hypothetical protein